MMRGVLYAFHAFFGGIHMVEKRESITAKLCAFARAWHSNRSREKIYDDYLAFDLLGREEYEEMYEMVSSGFGGGFRFSPDDTEQIIIEYIAPIPLSRIHFSESRLQRLAEENEKVQYVICGAGSDSFSFRSGNDNIRVFEIDHPDTQRYKLEKIKRLEWKIPGNVSFVPVDFEKERMCKKLIDAGFDPGVKTCFSILGVSYYLTLDVFRDTLSQIAELSSVGSILIFDYPHKSGDFPRRVNRLEEITRALGEEMQGGFEYGEISRALYSLGFQIDTYMSPEKVQKRYFEGRSDGMRAFENVSLLSASFTSGYNFE